MRDRRKKNELWEKEKSKNQTGKTKRMFRYSTSKERMARTEDSIPYRTDRTR